MPSADFTKVVNGVRYGGTTIREVRYGPTLVWPIVKTINRAATIAALQRAIQAAANTAAHQSWTLEIHPGSGQGAREVTAWVQVMRQGDISLTLTQQPWAARPEKGTFWLDDSVMAVGHEYGIRRETTGAVVRYTVKPSDAIEDVARGLAALATAKWPDVGFLDNGQNIDYQTMYPANIADHVLYTWSGLGGVMNSFGYSTQIGPEYSADTGAPDLMDGITVDPPLTLTRVGLYGATTILIPNPIPDATQEFVVHWGGSTITVPVVRS
jgi:hypothetical protein